MQGKGLVRFFLLILTLVCAYQYYLSFRTWRIEKRAAAYAAEQAANLPENQRADAVKAYEAAYLDSISTENVMSLAYIKNFTYQDLKNQQLALGLDLKGGMSVILQVDLREFITALADESEDPTFVQALDAADVKLKAGEGDYVTLFVDSWRELAQGRNLATIFRRSDILKEEINTNTSDGDMARILRAKADETVTMTYDLLKKRIDKLGVVQPNVSLDASRDVIVVELPGVSNPERARTFLQAAAKLEFWDVYRITDPFLFPALNSANDLLARSVNQDTSAAQVDTSSQIRIDTVYAVDTLGNVDSSSFTLDTIDVANTETISDSGPLFDLLELNQSGVLGLAVVGTAEREKRQTVSDMLDRPEIKALFPSDIKFLWSRNAYKDPETGEQSDRHELYAIKMPDAKGVALLEGDHVVTAAAEPDPNTGEMQVTLRMDETGSRVWGQMTQKAAKDNNREIAIVLDDEVASAPRVNDPILTGNSSISGNFTAQEARDLASILQIGKLPARTESIQESLVGPTLGKENINRSVTAMVLGFLLVLFFMIFYYGGGGIVSVIALFLNVFFIFGALASIGTVLTLPGIAGIVLTMGMAVDANVIIYERIREELRAGKSLLAAIASGYKGSYAAIIDANVTTLLTAMVLAYFGLGPIKGFAVVLIIGVLSSMFTAILITRLIIDWWTSKGRSISFAIKPTQNALTSINIDWLGKRKYGYFFSGALIVAGIISMATRGFDLGVDLKGGYSYNIEFNQPVTADALRTSLAEAFGDEPVVKAVDIANTYNVITAYNVDNTNEGAEEEVLQKLYEGVKPLAGGQLTLEEFRKTDAVGVTHVTSSTKVSATIASDIKNSSVYATVFALLLIFLYIFIRFSKWQFSAGAVLALFHDVLATLSIFTLLHGILPFSMEVDQAFVAAILTVIGYSVNDTVIVFDRLREYMGIYTNKDRRTVINDAINVTLSRTTLTSLTTLFTVVILFIFGGGSIKGFAFALIFGIAFGTYSSVFIATSLMYDFSKKQDLTGNEPAAPAKKTGFSKAVRK